MDVGQFAQLLQDQNVVNYIDGIAFTILAYDYILTARLEITLIWFSPWNYTKVLFILIRYLPLFEIYFHLRLHQLPDGNVSICRPVVYVVICLTTATLLCVQFVLSIRTWVVWYRDRKIGFCFGVLVFCDIAANSTVVTIWATSLKFGPPPFPQLLGCYFEQSRDVLYLCFIPALVINCIALALMSISAFRAYRNGLSQELSNVIHRDGILFYAILLIMAAVNLFTFVVLPPTLKGFLLETTVVLSSVFASRIILNIRYAGLYGKEDLTFELHDRYREEEVVHASLDFYPVAVS